MSEFQKSDLPARFGFLLINDFTLISLSSAIEPLRMANRICDQDNYYWKTISETGDHVFASDGLSVNVDCGISDERTLDGLDAVIVCSGSRVTANISPGILQWLKVVNQKGIALGAVCTGSYVLAQAGLLDGYRCSIHWENLAALTDLFPSVAANRGIFTIDEGRFTSSGGATPVDMMLHFISTQCGATVAAGVAEQFIFERIRQPDDEQRVPLKHLLGHHSRKLVVAVELMESNIREPLSQQELANYVGISRRQMQRLFRRYLKSVPSRYYLQIRLKRARELIRQTNRSLVEIAAMTGFVSTSHFSKSYKECFGRSPSVDRQGITHTLTAGLN